MIDDAVTMTLDDDSKVTITAVAHHTWGNPFYNIEAHGEPVCEIGDDDTLAHKGNRCALGLSLAGGRAKNEHLITPKQMMTFTLMKNFDSLITDSRKRLWRPKIRWREIRDIGRTRRRERTQNQC